MFVLARVAGNTDLGVLLLKATGPRGTSTVTPMAPLKVALMWNSALWKLCPSTLLWDPGGPLCPQ